MSLGEAVVDIGADTSKFRQQTKEGVDKGLAGASKSVKQVGRDITGVGASMSLAVTAPLVGIGVQAVKSAAQFEQTMNVMQAATGATGKDMGLLEKQAMELGASTVFSAQDAADAMLELGKAGQSTEQIMQTVPEVMNLAATEGLELGNAAGIVTSALSQFGLEATDSAKVVNALAGASNASKGSVADMAESLKLVGSAAAGIGMDVADTSAALAALADNGLEGSVAGTSLAAVFNRLVPQTDAARSAMKGLGLDFTNADGSFKSIYEISGELAGAFSGMSDEAKKIAIGKIFGNDASTIAAVNALVNTGADEWAKYSKATLDQNAASDLADARMSGLAGTLEQLSGAWDTFKLQIGQALAPVVEFVAQGLQKMIEGFGKLPKGMQTAIVIFGVIAAAIGPLIVVIGVLISSVGAIMGVFAAVSAPVLIVVGVIGALVVAFALFMAKSEAARAVVVSVFNQIKAIVAPAVREIGAAFRSDILPAMQAAWPIVQKVGVILLKAFGASVVNQVRAFVAVVRGIVAVIVVVIRSIRSFIGAVKSFIAMNKAAAAAVSSGFNRIRAVVSSSINAARAAVTGAISRMISSVAGGVARIRGAFSSGLAAARGIVSGGFASIRSSVSSGIGRVVSLVASLPGRVRGALGNLGSMLWSSGYSLISGFADGITSGIGKAVGAASSAVGAVRNLFPFSPAKEGPFSGRGYTTYSGEAMMKDFAKSIEKTANAAVPEISGAMAGVQAATTTPIAPAAGAATPAAPSVTVNTPQVDFAAALVKAMASLKLVITLGADRRTKAQWYLDGKKYAEVLA